MHVSDSRRPARRARALAGRPGPLRTLLWAWAWAWALAIAALAAPAAAGLPAARPPVAATPSAANTADVPLPAHQMVWRQWTVAEGLPQITVNAMVQDRAGYLWVGTQDGLARFDGVAFRHYSRAGNPGLGHDVVNALGVDLEGVLWIGTMAGLARFVDGGIVAVPAPGKGTGVVTGLRAHPDGGVWVAAENGLFHATGRNAAPVALGSDAMPMATVLQLENGPEVAVGVFDLVIDPRGARRVVAIHERVPPVISAVPADGGGLWLGTLSGLYLTDAEGRVSGKPLLAGQEVHSLAVDAERVLWIATDRGLARHRPGGAVEPVVVPGISPTEWVAQLYVDRENNLWVGTQLTGLHRASVGRFRRVGARDGLVDDAVWSIYRAPDGEMWAGTPDGLFRGGLRGFRKAFDGDALPHPSVSATLRDRRGGLWIGTYSGLAYQPAGAPRPVRVAGLEKTAVSALLEDDDGAVLAGTSDGLIRFRAGRGERIELPGTGGGFGVVGLVRGADGRLWAGHNDGVAYREDGRWHVAGDRSILLRGPVLAPFGDGVLAAALDGLFYVDSTHARRLGRADGLHVDVVHSVRVDGDAVWYQGPHGVGRIPARQLAALLEGRRRHLDVRVYGDLDSPQFAQCNGGQQDASALTGGRWLWCPSLTGLMVLDLQRTEQFAPPAMARLQALTTPARRIDLERAGTISLRPGERDIQIDYTGLSLRHAERLEFHGRLRGYDDRWQRLGRRRTAYYTNLPEGQYTFELYATNPDGVIGPVARLGFEIQPHWYETPLARVGAVLALVLLGWGALRWRLRALHRRREVLEERVRSRTAALEDANRKLQATSLTDPLTGLHNRRYLQQHLPHEIARIDRQHRDGDDAVLAFVHVDVDRFKAINDTHGHHVGDQVLQAAAGLLRETSRGADFVLRWGGEEFLVVGRDVQRAEIGAWAARIGERFRTHAFETDAGPLRVTCSIGHAAYPAVPGHAPIAGWEAVMNLADAATSLAKREGRDRSIGFEPTRTDLPADFAQRLHQDPQALADAGWLRILRGATEPVARAERATH